MAKFAQVGYGSAGQGTGQDGEGYTYLVSDNVRTGDKISPAVRHYKSGTIFGTTGKILSTTKETTAKADEIRQKIEDKNLDLARARASGEGGYYSDGEEQNVSIQEAATAKQIGISPVRGEGGKFAADRSSHGPNGEYIAGTRETATRGYNIKSMQQATGAKIAETRKAQKAVETFDSYSSAFLKKGD